MDAPFFLKVAIIGTSLELIIFKLCYPYAGFLSGDSYVYIQSAIYNFELNTYPVGYSKFLRIFSTFTRSDTALVAFQYFAIEASALALLFTLFNIFSPRPITRWLMFVFAGFNPVFLYISNYVSSDALFLALSLLWFNLLLRLLQRPTLRLLLWHLAVLLYALTVRYNALYYPAIAIICFLLIRESLKKKIVAILITVLPVVLYIFYITSLYYQLTGIRQFSPFSGWQLANNALYAYRYVDERQLESPPALLQPLDRMVRHYFDTSRDPIRHPSEMLRASTVYMWDPQSPLQRFMNLETGKDSAAGFFKRWAMMGPLYSNYGSWLIRHYPEAYLKFYLLQNALKFYSPPGEFLFEYNMGRDTVTPVAQNWFRYKSQKIAPAFGDYQVRTLVYMPILAAAVNFIFLLGYLGLGILSNIALRTIQQKAFFLFFCFWVTNFFFSVTAAPVTLRYQLFPILLAAFFACLVTERLYILSFPSPSSPGFVSDLGRG